MLIPLFGLVGAFGYRAFRLRVFKVSLVYAVAGLVVLTEVYFMLKTNDLLVRAFNVLLTYVGLWYFLGGASNLEDDEVNGQAINTYVNRRPRLAIVVVVVIAIVTIWYLLAPESGAELTLIALLLAGGFLFVAIRSEWSRIAHLLPKLRRRTSH